MARFESSYKMRGTWQINSRIINVDILLKIGSIGFVKFDYNQFMLLLRGEGGGLLLHEIGTL
jgi:hypothetical protein